MSQWEREEIASRVQASVPIRAKLGKSLGGQAPFGYSWKDNKLIINAEEAPVRKLMFELYLKLKRKKAVAAELTKRGFRTRSGSKFAGTSIERLLRDPLAKGTRRANYTKSLGDGKNWVLKPSEEWVLTACPAIVTEELWQACNSIMDEAFKPRGKMSPHLFTGLLHCTCGGKMYIAPRSVKYLCNECKKTQIPKDDIEEIYFEHLKGFLLSKDDLPTFQAQGQETVNAKGEEKNLLVTERSKVKGDMDKIMELHLKGQIAQTGFKSYYDPLQTRLTQIDHSLLQLDAELDFLKIQLLNGEYVLSNAENLYEKWPTMLRDEKRKVIEDLTEDIQIEDQEITIRFRYAPNLLQNVQNKEHNPTD